MPETIGAPLAGLLGRDSSLVRHLRPAYETFLNWSSGGRGIPCTINGIALRRDPRCKQNYPDQFEYDSTVATHLRAMVKPDQICFDVGANVGYYALQFAYRTRPSDRVLAFEPNPTPRAVLERQIAVNGLSYRVEIVAAAVADGSGETTLYLPGEGRQQLHAVSRLGAPDPNPANDFRSIAVPMIPLDDFCDSRAGLTPDCILMDIEGFEIAALKGARQLVTTRRGNLDPIVEMHSDLWNSVATPRAEVEALFAKPGLRPIPLTDQQAPPAERGVVHLRCE